MDRTARKSAIATYKERKPAHGVFAVICRATGETWVGQSRNLDAQQNGVWFALKHRGSPYRVLQAAWDLHGEDAFSFEELERLREDYPTIGVRDELKRRQALWATRLHAKGLG